MGLLIYNNTTSGIAFSIGGSFSNPLVNAIDGISGSTYLRKYYLRNNESDKSYSGITIQPVKLDGDQIIDGTNGFSWKLIAGDIRPSEEQWNDVSHANSVSMPNIGTATVADISTYEPFWLRITVPRGAPVKSHSGTVLRIDFTEILVP